MNWFNEAVQFTPAEAKWLGLKAKLIVDMTDKIIIEEKLNPSEAIIKAVENLLQDKRKGNKKC